jgi:hypothetical protein
LKVNEIEVNLETNAKEIFVESGDDLRPVGEELLDDAFISEG